jgi:ketosteroid isomerase-like protein
MSQENVEIVRAILEAFNRGDTEAVVRWVDPGMETESQAALGAEGSFRGMDGALEVTANFWRSFDKPGAEIDECVAAGEHVAISVRYFGRGRTSGIRVDTHGGQVVTFREGRIVRWRIFPTFDEALKAVGLED